MKLIKYCGYGTYKLKYDCDNLLKTIKGFHKSEEGIVAEDEDTVYHFDLDGKTYSICSKITEENEWSKVKCVNLINKILKNSRCYINTSFVVFQDNMDLEEGGPEMLYWNINKFQRGDIISNVWEPELYDSHIIRFKEFNNIEVNVEIKECGSISIACFPIGNSVSIEDLKYEATEVKKILEDYNSIVRLEDL